MRKIYIIILLILVSCEESKDESPIVSEPAGFYKIDVKTSFLEKSDYEGIKLSINNYIDTGSVWCDRVEFNEDFQLWIEDVGRDKIDENTRKVRFRMRLIIDYWVEDDIILMDEFVTCVFQVPDNINEVMLSSEKARNFINQSIEISKELGKIDPQIYVASMTAEKLMIMMDLLRSSNLEEWKKLEALFCGQIAGERLKLAILDYEKNSK